MRCNGGLVHPPSSASALGQYSRRYMRNGPFGAGRCETALWLMTAQLRFEFEMEIQRLEAT
jgi:hypothetical protein